jgi:Ca2+-binding RTX toxin-like protein
MLRRILMLLTGLAALAALGAVAAQAGAPKGDWPKIDGELWINHYDVNATHQGTDRNDELLGGHGDDRIFGMGGSDVIWGDQKASGNTSAQNDTIMGGSGDDWIYGSHGRNRVWAGPGNDTVRIWFGRGFVDCGAGRDILYVSRKSGPHVKRRNCETISHKSASQVAGGG